MKMAVMTKEWLLVANTKYTINHSNLTFLEIAQVLLVKQPNLQIYNKNKSQKTIKVLIQISQYILTLQWVASK